MLVLQSGTLHADNLLQSGTLHADNLLQSGTLHAGIAVRYPACWYCSQVPCMLILQSGTLHAGTATTGNVQC